ncbi:MAG: DUF3108 domain-containing protein [Chthoniobacterales bacterium]
MASYSKPHQSRALRFFLALACLATFTPQAFAQVKGEWSHQLTAAPVKQFPDIRSFTATFHFGWSDVFDAARASAEFTKTGDGKYTIHASGQTIGFVRHLWKMNATHDAVGVLFQSLPLSMHQVEKYAKKAIETKAYFQPDFSWSLRDPTPSTDIHNWRKVPVANLRDLTSAMLFVRSQPLNVGDEIVFTAFPGDSPYLARVHVAGRDTLSLNGESRKAIRLTLDIKKINVHGPDKGALLPHSKFHSGTIWISDDSDRMPIRAEVDIFVGYIYGQLDSIHYTP